MATTEQILTQLNRLLSVLMTSGLQQKDQPLFQVISGLIKALIATNEGVIAATTTPSGGGPVSDQPFLTHQNVLAQLPQSRQLLAGTNVNFDDSVFGERTINVPDPPDREWSVLTTGDVDNPELVFAGGQVIMLHTP